MRKKVNKKLIVALLSFVLLFGGTFGSSLAWLLDNSDPVTNTFETSNIDIELDESDNLDLKMIPGHTVTKDPKVTVIGGSEDCWLFVEITETLGAWADDELGANSDPAFTDFLNYSVDTSSENAWTRGEGEGENKNGVPTNVYFRKVTSNTSNQVFDILKDNKVVVSGEITKELMEEIDGYKIENDKKVENSQELNDRPKLSFKAYAVQLWETNKPANLEDEDAVEAAQFTPAEAWEKRPTTNP